MLKHIEEDEDYELYNQPPSGGCVLKHQQPQLARCPQAAAFGRLCVETGIASMTSGVADQPPSGGCVLKPLPIPQQKEKEMQPPSGGCVLKHTLKAILTISLFSRLRAAVC